MANEDLQAKDETIANAFLDEVRRINGLHQKGIQGWNWGDYIVELSEACGRKIDKPDEGPTKDWRNSARLAFTKAMRTIVPDDPCTLGKVIEKRHELVNVILTFVPGLKAGKSKNITL